MKFRERFLKGLADFDDIYDLTDEWNESGDPCTLRMWLGLTEEEEDVWISESDEALEALLTKEKNRKIFFTDLDGTLLNDNKEITAGNRRALDRIQREGHVVVVCTGRALASAILQAKRLGLYHPGNFIICYNGGQIFEISTERVIFSRDIPMDVAALCFEEARKAHMHMQAYDQTHVIAENENDELKRYAQLQNLPYIVTKDVTLYLKDPTPKLLCIDSNDRERLVSFREELSKKVAGELDIFFSQINYLEIVPHGVDKGKAVDFLCDYLCIPVSGSIAAGDGENDLPMIKAAGIGAAMCNGVDVVKQAADYITEKDNNHDAVEEILDRFIP